MLRGERGAGATGCNVLCCCSVTFWIKIATMLFESIVMAATAWASCLSREDIGNMGDG